MSQQSMTQMFRRMGARVDVTSHSGGRMTRRLELDIRHDGRDEPDAYFYISHRWDIRLEVLDVIPGDRHLLLRATDERTGRQRQTDVSQFLCGHDERSWFVAAVPEKAGASNVPTAMAALKPFAVRASEARAQLPASHRNRRKNRAFVRQGEWFFVPVARRRGNFVVDDKLVLRNEPLVRSGGARGGGKPHWAELCFRTGGRNVYVGPQQYGLLDESQYKALVTHKPHLKRSFRLMRRDAGVYVKGKVRHPDHKTITLHDWHEVQMNTETQAKAMRHVVFLD